MGKCLSCSQDEDDTTMQNGHAINTSTTQRTSLSLGMAVPLTRYHPEPPPIMSPRLPDTGDPPLPTGLYSRPQSSNGDKKLFSQYPKLPPIRKPSNGSEGKRTSFTGSRDISETKVNLLFDSYKDPEDDVILAEGIEHLCQDLDVQPDEFRVLVLAWKFQAETMCRFTRQEFVSGCKLLRADSMKGIQSQFPEMVAETREREVFKDLYRFTYKFGLDLETGQRTLPVDMAVSLWKLVFSENEPLVLKHWLHFLEVHPNVRGVPKDTWDMFLNFVEAVGDDLSSYDDTEAWPSLFDDFVEYENDRQNQNVKSEKVERDFYD